MSLRIQNLPSNKKTLVKMPTLELPDFFGDYMKWPEFWQLWYDVYHTETRLTSVQKFRYLLKYVKGEAYRAIEQITNHWRKLSDSY